MNKDLFINSFQVIFPEQHLSQNKINEWIIEGHMQSGTVESGSSPLRRFVLSDKYIEKRYFECNEVDFNWSDHRIYHVSKDTPDGASIKERNRFFSERALRVFRSLYEKHSPEHIVHVTCTGYVSPSPAQVYFSSHERAPAITHAYHMGCYASLPAVRMGMGLVMTGDRPVDIVHTEMCSLHLNSSLHTPEQMVVQTLFADGHIKYSIDRSGKGMRVLGIEEKLVPDSQDDMTWIPGANGMQMTLSREVPFKIRDSLPAFIHNLCEKAGVEKELIMKEGIFAIHPGGPKIIEAVQKKLELSDEQVSMSKKVLFERGNMSSATLPHVWNEILLTKPEKGTKILSLAFGPGLTIFGSIFEVSG